MTASVTCPGLQASWINGWLAAVGTTVLDSRLRLHWTEGPAPVAVISASGDDPVAILHAAWPRASELEDLPIAENWGGAGQLKRRVPVEHFVTRARAARSHEHSWTLSSTMTDLCIDKSGQVAHARFDPTVPKGITLHHRLTKVHQNMEQPSEEDLVASFENRSLRVKVNGLGFDLSRFGSLADDTDPLVDPVVEVLAFYGLNILPVRGPGRERHTASVQRGWLKWPLQDGSTSPRAFLWPAWRQPLDRHGIDALLDAWVSSHKNLTWQREWRRLGVHTGWQIVPYKPRGGSADATRGFGSERL